MQKKRFAWAMSMAVAAMITCTGCAQNTNSSGTDSGSSTAQTTTLDDNDTAEAAVGQSLSAIQSGKAGVTTDEDDLCDNYDAFDAEIPRRFLSRTTASPFPPAAPTGSAAS